MPDSIKHERKMKRKIKIFTDETKSKDLQRKIKTHSTNKIETPPKRIKQISEIWRKEFLGNLHMMSRKKNLKNDFFIFPSNSKKKTQQQI